MREEGSCKGRTSEIMGSNPTPRTNLLGLLQLPFPIIPLVAIAQWGPSFTVFLLVYRGDGKAGVEILAKRALKIPRPLRWLMHCSTCL